MGQVKRSGVFESSCEELGANVYTQHLGVHPAGKLVNDFLFVIIELFGYSCSVHVTSRNLSKSALFEEGRGVDHFYANFSWNGTSLAKQLE